MKLKKPKHHPLKRWRFENGLTMAETAKLLDCAQSYVSEIENRKKEPTLSFADKIVSMTLGAVDFTDLVLKRTGGRPA